MVSLILFCALLSLFASMVQSVTGFGYGIIVMAILPHLTNSVVSCTVLVGFTSTVISVMNAWSYRRYFRLRDVVILFLVYAPVSFAAVWAAGRIDGTVMKRILGAVLLLFTVYFVKFSGRIRIRPTLRNGFIASALSALFGGMFSTGGPPMAVYYLSVTKSKEEYLGNIQCFFLFSSLFSSAARVYNGYVTRPVLCMTLAAMAIAVAGVTIAKRFVRRIDAERQKKYIYALMAVSGVTLLFS